MTQVGTYYSVVAQTLPWTSKMRQPVGCYTNKDLANKVANFIRDRNIDKLPGGIDVFVEHYQGEFVKCSAGVRSVT